MERINVLLNKEDLDWIKTNSLAKISTFIRNAFIEKKRRIEAAKRGGEITLINQKLEELAIEITEHETKLKGLKEIQEGLYRQKAIKENKLAIIDSKTFIKMKEVYETQEKIHNISEGKLALVFSSKVGHENITRDIKKIEVEDISTI